MGLRQVEDLMEEIKKYLRGLTDLHVFVEKTRKEFPDWITKKELEKIRGSIRQNILILSEVQRRSTEFFRRP